MVFKGKGTVKQGDTIVVPPKLKTPTSVIVRDITQVLSQAAIIFISLYQILR